MYIVCNIFSLNNSSMDSSSNFQASPQVEFFLWSNDKVYHKQEVCFLLYFQGQIVSWQYNPNLLDLNWPCTVINDYDWQLWNCPYILPHAWAQLLCEIQYTPPPLLQGVEIIHAAMGTQHVISQYIIFYWGEMMIYLAITSIHHLLVRVCFFPLKW